MCFLFAFRTTILDDETIASHISTSIKPMSIQKAEVVDAVVQLPSFSDLLSSLPLDPAISTLPPTGEVFHRPSASSMNSHKVYLFPVRRLLEETATKDDGDEAGLGWIGQGDERENKRRRMSRSSRGEGEVSYSCL